MALSNIVAWSTYHHTPSRFIKFTSPMHVVSRDKGGLPFVKAIQLCFTSKVKQDC